MPENTTAGEIIAALFREFPHLERPLKERGVNLDDQDVQEAILITTKVFTDYYAERTDQLTSKIEAMNPRLDGMLERIKETESKIYRRQFFYKIAMFAAGLLAVTSTLVANFESFLTAFKTILSTLKNWTASFPFGVAYAATPLGTSEATASILPVIIYGIYILLAIGYVGSFFAMIFAPDKKVRSDAFEYLKQITALFIGVASGKLI